MRLSPCHSQAARGGKISLSSFEAVIQPWIAFGVIDQVSLITQADTYHVLVNQDIFALSIQRDGDADRNIVQLTTEGTSGLK